MQMEWLNRNVGSRQPALKQTPKIFHAVSVNAAFHILNSMVNYLMIVFRLKSGIAPKFVAVQRTSSINVFFHDGMQSLASPIWNHLSSHLLFVAVKHSHHDHLIVYVVPLSGDSAGLNALVHVAGLATDESFVYLNLFSAATEFHERTRLHSKANPLQHEPRCFLSNSKSAVNLVRRNAILAIAEQPNS